MVETVARDFHLVYVVVVRRHFVIVMLEFAGRPQAFFVSPLVLSRSVFVLGLLRIVRRSRHFFIVLVLDCVRPLCYAN